MRPVPLSINLSSLDASYQQTIAQPQLREASLLGIKRDLEAWSSMVPNCVTMAYNADTATSFRNNGMTWFLWITPQTDKDRPTEFGLFRSPGPPFPRLNEPRTDVC